MLSLSLAHTQHAYIRFAEPFRLQEYISTFSADRSLQPKQSADDKRKLIASLGYRIVFDINSVRTVMPASIVASILLAHPGVTIAHYLIDLIRTM